MCSGHGWHRYADTPQHRLLAKNTHCALQRGAEFNINFLQRSNESFIEPRFSILNCKFYGCCRGRIVPAAAPAWLRDCVARYRRSVIALFGSAAATRANRRDGFYMGNVAKFRSNGQNFYPIKSGEQSASRRTAIVCLPTENFVAEFRVQNYTQIVIKNF